MSATNLELCVTVIKDVLEDTLSYDSSSITDGRTPPPTRKNPHAHISRVENEKTTAFSGAKIREYIFEVKLYRRRMEGPEASTLDKALQADAEALFDAFDAKGKNTFSTLTGITMIVAEMAERDKEDDESPEQIAVVKLTFPFFEAYS